MPFIKQAQYTCGPSALTCVLTYWGYHISQKKIQEDLYIPDIKGSLNFEMLFFAQNLGLFSESYSGEFSDLKEKVSSNIPVIVLVKNLPLVFEKYHYIVVTGYDDQRKLIIANTGTKENALIPYKIFYRCWDLSNNWMLVICPPEKINWRLTHLEYNKLGTLFEKKGKLNQALDYYEGALKLKPNTPEYLFNLGNLYLKKGLFDEAKAHFETAISIDPNFADSYNNLACVYLEQDKDLDKAIELVKKAISTNPKNEPYYLDTMGLCLTHKGLFDEAIITYKKAIEQLPKDDTENLSIIYYHLALTQYKTGLIDEAGVSLGESLKIAPNGPMSVEAKLLLNKVDENKKF